LFTVAFTINLTLFVSRIVFREEMVSFNLRFPTLLINIPYNLKNIKEQNIMNKYVRNVVKISKSTHVKLFALIDLGTG